MSSEADIREAYALHHTQGHGLDGDPCREYCTLAGEVTHVPIGVNAAGDGPVMPHESGYVRTICWCERRGGCPIIGPHVEARR